MISDDAKVLLGIGLVTGMIFAGVIIAGNKSAQPPEPVAAEILIRDDSWQQETPNAAITLVEFLDMECESCRAAHPQIKQILEDYQGQITYVVRYFPLHKNSELAMKTVEAAGEQGKYWEMFDLLFERQTEWGEKSEPQTALFTAYAEELGLDMAKFSATLESSEYEDKIERDRRDGIAAGVSGTPTVFINGEVVEAFPTYNTLKGLIDQELAEQAE